MPLNGSPAAACFCSACDVLLLYCVVFSRELLNVFMINVVIETLH